jgi:hypothetical protein
MTAARKRTPKKMSLDRGFVPTKRQREIEKAFFKAGGRHPFYMSHIAAGSGLRESWEHRKFTKQRMARRLHVSPRGTYFWLAGLEPLAGCYLRADGSTQAFYGPWQPPLTCVGCGDASKQEDILCDQINKVPEELLAKLDAHDDLAPDDLLGRLKRDGGVVIEVGTPSRKRRTDPKSTSHSGVLSRSVRAFVAILKKLGGSALRGAGRR